VTGRRSIDVPGLEHPGLPIPAASRVGPLLATGGVRGIDRNTGIMPEDATTQVDLMFDNLRAIVEAGGGDLSSIVKITVWVASPEVRPVVNAAWIGLFPDPLARPARHTMASALPGGMLVQCDALAWLAP
jgi:enamine deaminase RidA (YjgF/YER057c/UK114 family)